MRFLTLVLALILLAGCTPPSMNLQRSALRSLGDVGVTVTLDLVKADKVKATQAEVVVVCDAVLRFLNGGTADGLTQTGISSKLQSLIPAKYRAYFSSALQALSGQTINVGAKIGMKNLRRINAAVVGIKAGARYYVVTDRSPLTP